MLMSGSTDMRQAKSFTSSTFEYIQRASKCCVVLGGVDMEKRFLHISVLDNRLKFTRAKGCTGSLQDKDSNKINELG